MQKNEINSAEIDDEKTDISNLVLKIYIGTYSGSIVTIENKLKDNLTKSKQYSFKSSENQVKTIVPNSNFIFTSGTDEIIRIYDTTHNEEKGIVVTYSGSISNIIVHKKFLYAISGNDIEVFKLKTFTRITTMTGHKNPINAFVIHSSGKLAFSVSRDNYLMMWNMIKHKCAFRYKFNSLEMLSLNFFNNEKYLVIGFVNKVIVIDYLKNSEDYNDWVILERSIISSFSNPSKIVDIKVHKNYIIIFKSNYEVEVIKIKEDNKISDTKLGVLKIKINDGDNGLKEMARLKMCHLVASEEYPKQSFIITVSSENLVNIFSTSSLVKSVMKGEEKLPTTINYLKELDLITDRFTCISATIHDTTTTSI